jgi:hypothetical protein
LLIVRLVLTASLIVWLATIAFGGLAVISSFFAADLDDKLSHDVIRRLAGPGEREKAKGLSEDA